MNIVDYDNVLYTVVSFSIVNITVGDYVYS